MFNPVKTAKLSYGEYLSWVVLGVGFQFTKDVVKFGRKIVAKCNFH